MVTLYLDKAHDPEATSHALTRDVPTQCCGYVIPSGTLVVLVGRPHADQVLVNLPAQDGRPYHHLGRTHYEQAGGPKR